MAFVEVLQNDNELKVTSSLIMTMMNLDSIFAYSRGIGSSAPGVCALPKVGRKGRRGFLHINHMQYLPSLLQFILFVDDTGFNQRQILMCWKT